MSTRIEALTLEGIPRIHLGASRSVFWELEESAALRASAAGTPTLEKEAWLAAVLSAYGSCGFNITSTHNAALRSSRACATLLYCPATEAPGCAQLPTAPVTSDAYVLTSLHRDPAVMGSGIETMLLDAAIVYLAGQGIKALEAFAWDESFCDDPFNPQPENIQRILASAGDIGLMTVTLLESAGFEIIRHHPVLPLLRLQLPPAHSLLTAEVAEPLLAHVPI
ncbi:hypothetical protein VH13_00085 [Corynebacterium ulcerans]|uniref:hypothetical protein n=1 Tax=Corynebacterium ulcerans TaxID=65058 RepID=UPI0006285EA7|nr:hypothetical protein [Corynebacterium ulcerans]KKO85218.1 hypothetical protein VH15_10210 [Corynebacterium ulcerans]KKO86231.1 hypothetical protein VH13_00085 [Corynebacterium ulcerans]BDV27021.1 hypothetical protein CULTSU28_22690 [Corynebacterium ulcerans]